MPPKGKGATATPPAPITVTRQNVREIPPAFYETVSLRTDQIPPRLRAADRRAVAVAFRLAGGDVRPGRAKPNDAAWTYVQIDDDGHVSME